MTDTRPNPHPEIPPDSSRDPTRANTPVYIVYTYTTDLRGHTKYVEGIYLDPKAAVDRQRDLIPKGEFGPNGSRCGRDTSGHNKCAFINVLRMGAQHTELFTTSIPNWRTFA